MNNANYEKPHQYASGVIDVFVNGTQILKDGNHTGATAGKLIKEPRFGKGNLL